MTIDHRTVAAEVAWSEVEKTAVDSKVTTLPLVVPPYCPTNDEEKAQVKRFEDEIVDRLFSLNARRAAEERAANPQPIPRAKKSKPEPPDPRLSSVGTVVDRYQQTTTELIKTMGHVEFAKGMRRARDPERAMRLDGHQCKSCWYSCRGTVWTFDRSGGCAWCGAEVEK